MVFTCSGCGTRYRIDDERIRGKSLRVACKKCHQRHRIRDTGQESFTIEILATGGPSDSQDWSDVARPTTSMPSASAPLPDADQPPPPPVPVPETWFALRKGVRLGPFDRETLLRQLQEGELLPSSFVWRPTMPSWQRMEGIPELARVLRDFLEGAKRAPAPPVSPATPPPPPSRTPAPSTVPDAASPREPGPAAPEETPPPLPARAREAVRPSIGATGSPPSGRLADELFVDLSRPTIDLRRAAEIQPEEPEQKPRQRLRTPSSQSPRPAPPPSPVPPAPEASPPAGSPHSDFSPLFPDPWPQSGDGPVPDLVLQVAPRAQVPAVLDPHVGVRDFSVMVRHLGRKDRRRNLYFAIAAGGLLVLGSGSLLAWVFLSGPKGGALPIEEVASHAPHYEAPPPQAHRPRELPRISLLEQPAEPSPAGGGVRSRPSASEAPPAAGGRIDTPQPTPPPPALPAIVDEEARKDTARYGTLIARAEGGHREADTPVEAPKTLETIPRTRMSQQLMNEFLEKKHRRFEACKSQMKKPQEGQILVGIAFEVTPAGQVQNVRVVPKDGVWDGNLTRCIRDVILEWAFPPQPETLFYQTNLML